MPKQMSIRNIQRYPQTVGSWEVVEKKSRGIDSMIKIKKAVGMPLSKKIINDNRVLLFHFLTLSMRTPLVEVYFKDLQNNCRLRFSSWQILFLSWKKALS